MKRQFSFFRITLCSLLLLFLSSGLWGEGFFSRISWSGSMSVYFIPEDNGSEGAPMPVLISPGAAAAYPIYKFFWAEVTLDFYGTYYGYSEVLDRAVPVASENRSSFILGSLLGIQALFKYDITGNITLRAYAGPAFSMPICFIAGGLEGDDREDAASQNKKAASYFWGKGRWFTPVVGVGMDFGVLSNIKLGFDARVWFPLYKAWAGGGLPGAEGWRFMAGIRFTFR